jgi:phage shock protein E
MTKWIAMAAILIAAGAAIFLSPRSRSEATTPQVRERPSYSGESRGPEAHRWVSQGALLVDVRTAEEYASGHIEGAVNVPLVEIEKHSEKIEDKTRPVVVYCTSGARSSKVTRILRELGYKVYDLGAMSSW